MYWLLARFALTEANRLTKSFFFSFLFFSLNDKVPNNVSKTQHSAGTVRANLGLCELWCLLQVQSEWFAVSFLCWCIAPFSCWSGSFLLTVLNIWFWLCKSPNIIIQDADVEACTETSHSHKTKSVLILNKPDWKKRRKQSQSCYKWGKHATESGENLMRKPNAHSHHAPLPCSTMCFYRLVNMSEIIPQPCITSSVLPLSADE